MTPTGQIGRPRWIVAATLGVLAAALAAPRARAAGDAPGVDAQYRLAQRLAADRSPDAAQAFERVVAMAPNGPLADDAQVALARLRGAPEWPEDAVRLDLQAAAAATTFLTAVLDARPAGDRVDEARYLLALVRMAPLAARDAQGARHDLIAVAASPGAGRWAARARYALGVLAEQDGATDRAAGAYARALMDGDEAELAARARAGFARASLGLARFGDGAAWAQAAVDSGAPASARADALRALAVREIASERDPARRWSARTTPLPAVPTTRGASLIATAGDGSIAIFDRKNETLQTFDTRGSGSPPIPAAGATALSVDPYGRLYVAAGDALFRLEGAALVTVARLGAFKDASAIAVDAAGTVWIADRRGDKIGRLGVGVTEPVVLYDTRGAGVSALVASGGRIFAAQEKAGRVVELPASGPERPFGPPFRRPVALAADAAGRLTVLDEKAATAVRLSSTGEVRETLALAAAGVSRAVGLAAADDGAVRILDAATGSVGVAP